MNQKFPKVARDVLARQTTGDVHPSVDVLNAYVEQSLTAGERERVLLHLTGCAECREVVFLTSSVAEVPSIATAPAKGRSWLRWRWAVPAVALVAIVSAVLFQQRTENKPAPVIVATSRIPEASPASPPSESRANISAEVNRQNTITLSEASPKKLPATTPKAAPSAHSAQSSTEAITSMARQPGEAESLKMQSTTPGDTANSEATSEQKRIADAIEQSLLKPAPAVVPATPPRTSFREAEVTPETPSSALSITPAMRLQPRSGWRITQGGQLERSVAGSEEWSRVLADQPVTFRVVSVIRNNVWAGGNGGVLFHSADGGTSWSKVPLNMGDQVEVGNITAIQFTTPQQGRITTEGGPPWTTSDGGKTWTKP